MEQTLLTGSLNMAQTPDGHPAIQIETSPGRVYLIPIPDQRGPNGEPSAKQIVMSALSGIEVARAMPAGLVSPNGMGGPA